MDKENFETKILHVSYEKKDAYNALAMPIYNSIAYEFDTAEEMEKVFCGQTAGYFYSRVTNPTVTYFENRVCEVTNALSVTALSSGMAAVSNVLFAITYAGSNIVTSSNLFGNTYSLMTNVLTNLGVEIRFCDFTNPKEIEVNIDKNTCALFIETISNPQLEVVDLKNLTAIGNANNVPLIADTTIVPFCVFDAKAFGVNIEVISSTKYISGGATSTGGLILDYGTFDWSRSKVLKLWQKKFGFEAFTARMKKEICRNIGSYMAPQTAYMQTLGLETMRIRFERQASTCLEIARRLQTMAGIKAVNYPGLENNPFNSISNAQFGKYPGAMLTFDLASREACFSFLNKLKIIKRATNLFDNKTLIIHSASTIYGTFTSEQREKMNIKEQSVRLSVGLESADDLFDDIQQALEH